MKMQTPTLCQLYVVDRVKGRVIVARGTVFPSNNEGGNMIHNNPVFNKMLEHQLMMLYQNFN